MAELQVAVVAVDHKVWSGVAKSVVAKTPEGEIGILPGHEPVLSLLVDGVVRIETTEGQKISVAVHGGFFAVDSNEVKVLAEVAELDAEIDVARAQAALDRASGADSAEQLAAYRRAETRLKAAADATASGLHS
ncbi:MAG: F0F1 ATP synthase subunit epsilon [Actinomycetales bacterium]|nr:F0F1 ATP synthase subunit epsilon [Actinomycetales bacterium]